MKLVDVWVTVKLPIQIDVDSFAEFGTDVEAIAAALNGWVLREAPDGWAWSGGPDTPTIWAERFAARNARSRQPPTAEGTEP